MNSIMDSETRKERETWLIENINRAEWREHGRFPGLIEFWLDDQMLAWIQRRPAYCDRGHWQGQLEFSPGNPLNAADGLVHYYMRLETAKQELREKLLWRVCKMRVE